MLFNLTSAGEKSLWQSTVLSLTDEGHYGPLLRKAGVEVISVGGVKGILSPVKLFRLILLLRHRRFHLIQSWLYHGDFLGIPLSLLLRCPLIWNLRCSSVDWKTYSPITWRIVKLLARLSRFPKAVIVNSSAGLDAHRKLGYRPRKWVNIPNGFDTKKFQPKDKTHHDLRDTLNLPLTTRLIGTVGKWDPLKDYPTLFEGARLLLTSQNDVHFVMWGMGLTKENKELVSKLEHKKLGQNFHLMGLQPNLENWLPGLDLFTLTSKTEGFPNVLGEAMACGIPCVSTNAGAAAEIIDQEGVVVEISNASQLMQGWVKILSLKKEEYLSLSNKVRNSVLQRYSLNTILDAYHQLYLRTIA